MSTDKTTYDFSAFDKAKPDEYDFSAFDVKKKEVSFEDFETTMQGVSKAPPSLESGVPSTTDKEIPQEDIKPKISQLDTNIKNWYDKRGGISPPDKIDRYTNQINNLIQNYNKRSDELINQGFTPEQIKEKFEIQNKSLAEGLGLIYQDGSVKIPKNDIKIYTDVYRNEIRSLKEKTKDPFIVDLAEKLDEGMIQAGLGLKEIGGKLLMLNLIPQYKKSTEEQREYIEIRNQLDAVNERYDKGTEELLKAGDYRAAAGNAALSAVESLPSLMLMFTNPVYGLLIGGLLAANEKAEEIKDIPMPYYMRSLNVVGTGLLEIGTEKLTTIPMMNKATKAITEIGEKSVADAATKSLTTALQTGFRRAGLGAQDIALEVASEGLNQYGQNFIEKATFNPDKNIRDGVIDAMAAAIVTSGVIKSPNIAIEGTQTAIEVSKAAITKAKGETLGEKVESGYEIVADKYGVKDTQDIINEDLDIEAQTERDRRDIVTEEILDTKEYNQVVELNEQIAELDKDIAIKQDKGEDTTKEEQAQDELIKIKDDILTQEPQKAILEPQEAIKKEKPIETIPEKKEAVKEAKIEEPSKVEPKEEKVAKIEEKPLKKEEVKDGVQEIKTEAKAEAKEVKYETKEAFKQDFLSDDTNLNQIDVPLKQSEKLAAAKNLREGKKTKQSEILEAYLDESFEQGNLQVITEAAGGQTIKTSVPLESIIKPVAEVKEAKSTIEKNRRMGEKALASTTLSPEVKAKIKKHGITYFTRGAEVTESEAKEIANIYKQENNREGLKVLILDKNNDIRGDTRTELSVAYAEESQKLADTAKTPEEKKIYENDLTDVYVADMESSTQTAQDLQAKSKWSRVVANNPEVQVNHIKRIVKKRNEEFLDKHKGDIETTQDLIEEYFESDEFKQKVEKAVNKKYDEYIKSKLSNKERRERGKQKLSSALDKLANLSGAKKNAVAENDTNADLKEIANIVIEIADGLLDIGIANTADLLHKIKVATREHLSPRIIDDLSEQILSKTDAENRLAEPKAKDILTDKDIKSIVDKIYSKALVAKKSDLRHILYEALDVLFEEGSIDSDAFQELYSKAFGQDFISEEVAQEIRESQEVINDARKIRNNIEYILDDIIKEQQKEVVDENRLSTLEKELEIQRKEYKEAVKKAERANTRLSDIFSPEKTLAQGIATSIQAGLMSVSTFVLNPMANVLSIAPRAATMYLAWGGDFGLSAIGILKERWLNKIDRNKYPTLYRNILRLADKEMTYNAPVFSKYYTSRLPSATWETLQDLLRGQTSEDAFIREISRALHPVRAGKRVVRMMTGKERFALEKFLTNIQEGTIGYYSEAVFRLLNLGDKPFRLSAMWGRLNEIASIKKLKGAERTKFLTNPDEVSLSDAMETGLKSTFQQDTKVSKALLNMKAWANSMPSDHVLAKLAKGLVTVFIATQLPFVKTLVNLANEGATYALPGYSPVLAINAIIKGDRRKALDYSSRTAIGWAIRTGVTSLMAVGAMTLAGGGREKEEDEYAAAKVKKAEYVGAGGAYRLNVPAAWRFMTGGNPEWQDKDWTIDFKPTGIAGIAAMAKAEAYRGLSPDEIKDAAWFDNVLGTTWGAVRGVTEQGFFTGPTTFLKAFTEGGNALENWAVNTSQALRAAAIPNTYVAINKYRDKYIRETREKYISAMDSKTKKIIANTFKANLSVDSDLPIKVSIYGEDVERYPNKSAWVLLDPLKLKRVEADYAFKIFELYTRTKDESVFPSYPQSAVRMRDEENKSVSVKLNTKLYNEYAKRLLQGKASLLKSVTDSKGWDIWSDEDKILELTDIHKTYGDLGQLGSIIKAEFMNEYDEELEKLRIQQKKEKED